MNNLLIHDNADVHLNTSNIAFQDANSLLALMHGKADSICRVSNKDAIIGLKELDNLNEIITNKLSIHTVHGVTTSLDVVLSDKTTYTFKTWLEFKNKDWHNANNAVKSIFIQWDFFLSLEQYTMPQRHTLNIRISTHPNPSEIFKAMVSGGFDEKDSIDTNLATMICKVDFVSNVLAEELLHKVEEWYNGCESAISKGKSVYAVIYRFRQALSRVFEIIVGTALVLAGVLLIKFKFASLLSNLNLSISSLVIFGLLFFLPIGKIYSYITAFCGVQMHSRLSNVLDVHAFRLTDGDRKEVAKIKHNANIRIQVVLFIVGIVADIALAVIFAQ